MTHPIRAPRKLIEVGLPLIAINEAAQRENFIYRGNPSALHKWWAQRPLAVARAVIFAQLVNDPSWKWELEHPGKTPPNNLKGSWAAKRKQLFELISELVVWENMTNVGILERARREILRSWEEACELNQDHPEAATLFNPQRLPGLHDPFAGGGTIPLEAQRLGLEAYASDLNPVAVLINKAMIEIPPKFAGRKPIGPVLPDEQSIDSGHWPGSTGLAQDVRRYGAWMRREAEKRIGHLYPPVEAVQDPETGTWRHATQEDRTAGRKVEPLTVIAWLWARTVKSPNPVYSHVDVPLVSSFVLSSKEGKETWVEPIVEGDSYRFEIRKGTPPEGAKEGTKLSRGANFGCILSGVPLSGDYIKAEGMAGRMKQRLLAIVAEGDRQRIYLPPSDSIENLALNVDATWRPGTPIPPDKRSMFTPLYGLTHFHHLFTERQLVALTSFSDLVGEVVEKCYQDGLALSAKSPLPPLSINGESEEDRLGLEAGGIGARAYADAIAVYLSFALNKAIEYNNSIVVWYSKEDRPKGIFARHAIPMVWDFAESNILSGIGGGFSRSVVIVADSLSAISSTLPSHVFQCDATDLKENAIVGAFVSTDPPYYDNIGYADLSDFFYVWLRRSLAEIFPSIFATMEVPKRTELIATPYRHTSKRAAEDFFLLGMTNALKKLGKNSNPAAPITIYYAFKQSEVATDKGISSTGWESFLSAVVEAGLSISGTWPIRTERAARAVGQGTNSLASSIVLVCRRRDPDAPVASRRELMRELNRVLPLALDEMTKGTGDDRSPVAPVDLSQAMIGPGMAIFSRYARVLEADGSTMSVKTALQLINRFLAEDDFDSDTQFCLHWFEQYGWRTGPYGEADVLARAKATSVEGLVQAGVVESGGGHLRLYRWSEYPAGWDPGKDLRLPIWEILHHLIRALDKDGEAEAGRLLAAVPGRTEAVRQLAYRLYTLCERAGMADDARSYNGLVTSWSGVEGVAATHQAPPVGQMVLIDVKQSAPKKTRKRG